jgi:hypothetical protein
LKVCTMLRRPLIAKGEMSDREWGARNGEGGEERRTTEEKGLCLCLLLQDLLQSCARGGRRIVEDMCYEIRRAEACAD